MRREGFPAHAGMDPAGLTANRLPASPRTRGWTPIRGVVTRSDDRLPRARGDGPSDPVAGRRRGDGPDPAMASPRTRGWTHEGAAGDAAVSIPAHAGMDLGLPRARGDGPDRRPVTGVRFARLPRARGDGPALTTRRPSPRSPRTGPITVAASPRTRGWTRGGAVGFPAGPGTPLTSRLPRARGDGPRKPRLPRAWTLDPVCFGTRWVASPRTRGWTPLRAHAGMDPCCR